MTGIVRHMVLICAALGLGFVTFAQQVKVVRGPYLQMATQESVIVRWSTNVPASSKVFFGFDTTLYFGARFNSAPTTDHEIKVDGLLPDTQYAYTIGTTDSVIHAGGNLFFQTLPEPGVSGDYSFMILGDAGQGSQPQRDVSIAFQEKYGRHHDGVILLGDNAYWSGTQQEYQDKFFNGFYNEVIENTVIWPAPGNHDYYGASIPMSTAAPYFDIFNCPVNGECGGLPSGTEQFYSFDYGNIHFVSLDSYAVDRSPTAYMAQWLEDDLSMNTLPWVIAFWHHPPYSKGSHDSDDLGGGDYQLVEMRENIVPILENYDVDLVLNGHSHSYERSFLIAEHYGYSSTFSEQHLKSKHSGNDLLDCAYYKFTDSLPVSNQGAVYSVVGTSGWLSPVMPDWPHPVMYAYSNHDRGAMRLRVKENVLTAEFLTMNGTIFDRFVIKKDIYEELPGGCAEPVKDDWKLVPNPATSEIVFHSYAYQEDAGDGFRIYNMSGQIVHHFTTLHKSNTVPVGSLEAGVYILELHDKGNIRRMRFVKI